jgi:hypothetical protein
MLWPPAAEAEPSDFFELDAPADAEPSDFLSVDAEAEPLADGELELLLGVLALLLGVLELLLGVLALPDAPPLADAPELDFCSWVADGVWLEDDSDFFSCATAPNDRNAAATATAMGLNLMGSPFLDDYLEKRSKVRAPLAAARFA